METCIQPSSGQPVKQHQTLNNDRSKQGMAKEWIEQLAQDIKQRNHEAAQDYGRAQHYAGIIATQGKEFFVALVLCLQENVDALRSQLQGDLTSSETRVQTSKADEVKITRSRFPWIDARLIHHDDTITLDYAKSAGLVGDLTLARKTATFAFQVAPDDTLSVQDAFSDPPRSYPKPEDLARTITEILFGA
jgi:hypothetical protein